MAGNCFFSWNEMLCSILLSIVNKEMGKKVRFRHNKDHFPQISLKMGTLVRTKNVFIAISLVKLNHSHRKYSRKKFYRRIFLKCEPQMPSCHGAVQTTDPINCLSCAAE